LINGLSASVEIFSEEFRKRGHRVFIFAPKYPGFMDSEEGVFRFPSLRALTHHNYRIPLPISPTINSFLPRLELDLIHAQHPFLLGSLALKAARRLNVPLIFTHHTLYERYIHYFPIASAAAQRLAIRLSTSFANQADLVIAPTQGLREILQGRGVYSRIEVIPTGVEAEDHDQGFSLTSDLGIPPSSKILLSVGRLAKEKNLGVLLEVFLRLAPDFPDLYLILVGEGDERPQLQAWVTGQGLGDRVRFVGERPRKNLAGYYRGAHLLLFTSLSEAQGLVLLESMIHGLPVLALRSFAAEELIEDGINGCLADGVEALARQTRDLLQDEMRRRSFSQKAEEKAKEFAAPAMAERMLNLYRELLEERKER
jgi:glycosyltransferase involved in cell wall biosynthesis